MLFTPSTPTFHVSLFQTAIAQYPLTTELQNNQVEEDDKDKKSILSSIYHLLPDRTDTR